MRRALFIVVIIMIWGCSENETTPVTPDTTPPTVVSTSPADGDSNVSLYSQIKCTFSEEMNAATIDDSSFKVSFIQVFPGVITYDNKTATHTHAAPMRRNCTYKATITTDAKDIAGNSLIKDYIWTFHTFDNTFIESVYPPPGDTTAYLGTQVSVTFSFPMDPTTVNPSTFYLSDGVTGSVVYNGNTAVLTPDSPLMHNHTYTATITGDVTDTAGNIMGEDYVWPFKTLKYFSIESVSPADGDTGVNLNTSISVTFTVPMDPSTIIPSTFYIIDGVSASVAYDGQTAVLTPYNLLMHNHTYSTIITGDVADTVGNPLGENYRWSFTTTGGPEIVEASPPDSAINIAVDTVIEVVFSDDMDPGSLTPSSFYLSDGVTGTISYSNRTAKLIPDDSLMHNHTYTVTVTTDVTDIDSNPLAENYEWSFTTSGTIMPLAVGNKWVYYVQTWDTLRNLTGQYYDSILIVDSVIIDSTLWYVDQNNKKYTNKRDGLWASGIWGGEPNLSFKYPADTGDVYDGTDGFRYFVLSTDWPVTVDAGDFACFRYLFGGIYMYDPIDYYKYYAPNVGLILFESFQTHGYRKNWPVKIKREALVDYYIQ